jgi:hypothetical protein
VEGLAVLGRSQRDLQALVAHGQGRQGLTGAGDIAAGIQRAAGEATLLVARQERQVGAISPAVWQPALINMPLHAVATCELNVMTRLNFPMNLWFSLTTVGRSSFDQSRP